LAFSVVALFFHVLAPQCTLHIGTLYFVDDDACESTLDKFVSILSTLGGRLIRMLMDVLFMQTPASLTFCI